MLVLLTRIPPLGYGTCPWHLLVYRG